MSYDSRSNEEFVYGELGITFSGRSYPLTCSQLNNSFFIYHRDLFWDGTSTYNGGYEWSEFLVNCLIELKITIINSGTELFRGIPARYATCELFLEYVNSVVPNDGVNFLADCQIKIFNKIKKDSTSITKISAQNSFYSALNGTARLQRNTSLAGRRTDHFDYYQDFVINAWSRLFDVTVTPVEYIANELDWLGTIWVQSRKAINLYNLPAINRNMAIQAGSHDGARRCLVPETGNTLSQPDNNDYFYINRKIACYINQDTQTIIWDNNPYTVSQQRGNYSSIMVYGLTHGNEKSIYIKPLGGIDTFCVPKFDTDKYRLEGIFSGLQHHDIFRIIPEGNNNSQSFTYSSRVHRDSLFLGNSIPIGKWKKSASKDIGRDVRLYLREIGTDYVTPVGRSYIKVLHSSEKSSGSGLDFLIKSD